MILLSLILYCFQIHFPWQTATQSNPIKTLKISNRKSSFHGYFLQQSNTKESFFKIPSYFLKIASHLTSMKLQYVSKLKFTLEKDNQLNPNPLSSLYVYEIRKIVS